MNPIRTLATALAAMSLALPQVATAQYVLNVRDADVRAFVADAAEVTGRTFIVDGRVQGKVSVVSDRPLSRSEYFEVFLSTLRANGLVAVPSGNGAFRIQPAEGAATQPSRIGSKGAARNQMVTEVIRLRSIDAAQAVETLRPLVSREGSLTANRAGRSLVLVDYADNVRRIRALLGQIDRVNVDSTQSVALDNAGAREIAAALNELIPAASEGGQALATIVAVDSSNTLLLRGDPGTISRLATTARQLDASAARGSEIKVVWLDYADAAQMVPMLERLVGGQGGGEVASGSPPPISLGGTGRSSSSGNSGTNGAAGSSTVTATTGGGASASVGSGLGNGSIQLAGGRGTAVITRYPGANAVVISAPLAVQRRLTEVIRQLDQRQDQVLVEAIIVEVSDNVARQLGVQFLFGGKNVPFAVTNFSNIVPNIIDLAGGLLAKRVDQNTTVINGNTVTTGTNSAAGDLLRQNAITALGQAQGGYTGGYTTIGQNAALGVLINAVQADSNSNILSTPHITTNNNVPASILFGQEIPVSTGEALSNNFDNAFRTIQRQNVGIELDVTPQINADNEVRLDLRQEVSSIVGPVSDKFNELIINKREIKTTITVASGEIAVLGGLLDDNERRTIQKIPLLGDIPILGELFKSRGKSRVKTNLMIFIRPTILRSQSDREATTARRYGIIREAQRQFDPKVEPAIDQLVIDYLGTTPPGAVSQPGDVLITPAQARPTPGELAPVAMPPSGL